MAQQQQQPEEYHAVETDDGNIPDEELAIHNHNMMAIMEAGKLRHGEYYPIRLDLEDHLCVGFYVRLRESAQRALNAGYLVVGNALIEALETEPFASYLRLYDRTASLAIQQHPRVRELRNERNAAFHLPPNKYLYSQKSQ